MGTRLRVAHKLLIGGAAFAFAFMLALFCATGGIEPGALRSGVLVLSFLSGTFAACFLLMTGRRISRALALAAAAATELAAGKLDEANRKLSAQPKPRFPDETSAMFEALGRMTVTVISPLRQLHQSGMDVSGSSIQLAASVKQLEATVIEQAASTNEVTATSKEIFTNVQELVRTMCTVQRMVSEAASLAGAGMENLNGINSTMRELLDATAGVSSVLTAISERAGAISQVITAITNIANRTNLISLNAAIEAEKAGQHAAGFSVVAVQIRKLADQTAVAALDIEKMIGEMQAAVKDGVAGMSRFSTRARASSDTIAGITTDLSHLIEYTRQLEPHFEAVNNGVQMQSKAAGQILEAMQQLAETAGQTRDALTQFRQVADRMRSAVQLLQSEAGRFPVSA